MILSTLLPLLPVLLPAVSLKALGLSILGAVALFALVAVFWTARNGNVRMMIMFLALLGVTFISLYFVNQIQEGENSAIAQAGGKAVEGGFQGAANGSW